MPRWYVPLAIVILAGCTPVLSAGPELDWSAWQHMPSFHNGRMMPVNTFARNVVEQVTGRVNPTLSLERVKPGEADSEARKSAQALFPNGKPRRFEAPELLFSWLVEPERWEHVPFLIAEHETLRQDVLGLPVTGSRGEHLKYASPAQVQAAPRFRERMMSVIEKQRAAQSRGAKPSLTSVEQKLEELYEALTLYRLVTFDPGATDASRSRFLDRISEALQTWGQIESDLSQIASVDQSGLGAKIDEVSATVAKIRELAHSHDMPLDDIEPRVAVLADSTAALAGQFGTFRQKLLDSPPPMLDADKIKQFRIQMHGLAAMATKLARQAEEAHLALYDNGYSLRLVPALNPAALEKNRDTEDDAQPWLSLQTLLYGSDAVLHGYPPDRVSAVRTSFAAARKAYAERSASDRPQRFSAAIEQFASAVRTLGEEIEPIRNELPIQQKDRELIAATAYPPAGATDTEVHYYKLDPFFWSWLVGAFALSAFGLSFGLVRKPMFWAGMTIFALAQVFTIYGLGLRVVITGWAPVTNMFETVVFVALVVALLGMWFTVVPMLWPGLSLAWRLTAVPGTPESRPLDAQQAELIDSDRWTPLSWALLIPRTVLAGIICYLLTGVEYGSGGGYTVVALWPRTDVGGSVPTIGNGIVWLVGLAMLALAVWLVPRLVVALAAAVFTVPYSLAKLGTAKPTAQMLARKPFVLAGGSVAVVAGLLGWYAPGLDKGINPLMPVLRDNFWLTVHVLTITASYGAGFLAWGLGLISLTHYLFGRYREPVLPAEEVVAQGHRPAYAGEAAVAVESLPRRAPEACDTLGTYIYKSIQVAVLLLAAGTILGGLWADVSWGRFWGWDSKEVWALVSCLIYLAILHGRYAGLFGNFGLAVGSVFGATSILMAWYGVNFVLGSGLHSYGEGTGGLGWAMTIVALNWAFVGLAWFRYFFETGKR